MGKTRKSTCRAARTSYDRDTILLRRFKDCRRTRAAAKIKELKHKTLQELITKEKSKRLHSRESKKCEKKKPTIDDFDMKRLLGKGGYGKVFLARHRSSAELLAIKVIKVIAGFSLNRLRTIEKERNILQQNEHPFLISLHSAFHISNGYCLVMEYLEGGDLWNLLRTLPLSESSVRFYSTQIILALSELHRRHIVYIDLKLENVMLDREGHIRLVDYGLCITGVSPGNYVKKPHFVGTIGYLSPEESDMILDHRSGFQEPTFCESLSTETVSILKGLLTQDYLQRLGSGPDDSKEIQSHDFFKDINWSDVLLKKVVPPHEPNTDGGSSEGNASTEESSLNDGSPCLPSLRLPLFTFQREEANLREEDDDDDEIEIMT